MQFQSHALHTIPCLLIVFLITCTYKQQQTYTHMHTHMHTCMHAHVHSHMHTQVFEWMGKRRTFYERGGHIFISLVDILSGDGIYYDTSMSIACDLELDVS